MKNQSFRQGNQKIQGKLLKVGMSFADSLSGRRGKYFKIFGGIAAY